MRSGRDGAFPFNDTRHRIDRVDRALMSATSTDPRRPSVPLPARTASWRPREVRTACYSSLECVHAPVARDEHLAARHAGAKFRGSATFGGLTCADQSWAPVVASKA